MKHVEDTKGKVLKDEEGNTLTKYYSEYGDAQNKHIIFYNKGVEIDSYTSKWNLSRFL